MPVSMPPEAIQEHLECVYAVVKTIDVKSLNPLVSGWTLRGKCPKGSDLVLRLVKCETVTTVTGGVTIVCSQEKIDE